MMLDLEVVPERSLGNEQWEFILGKVATQFVHCVFPLITKFIVPWPIHLKFVYVFLLIILRNACCTMRTNTEAAMPCDQICASYVQRGGKCFSSV